ncbi:MAG: hypothetical protein FJX89_09255 [Bacteroidetes bacterium]|nr:hypothetical protein [Bacteroidota bacterium]
MRQMVVMFLIGAAAGLPVIGQGLSSLTLFGHPSTAAVADMPADAFGVAAQLGARGAEKGVMAGLRCVRLAVEGAPSIVQGVLAWQVGTGTGVLQAWHAGQPDLREHSALLSYSLPLTTSLHTGLGLGYARQRTPLHPSWQRLQVQWGAVCRVYGGLRMSIRVALFPPLVSAHPVFPLPVAMAAGLGYTFSPQLALAAELLREGGRVPVLTPVLYYRPAPSVTLRVGVRTDNGSFSLTIAYRFRRFGIDVGGRQVGLLGWCGDLALDWRPEETAAL